MVVRHRGPGPVVLRVVEGQQAGLLEAVGLPDELDAGQFLLELPTDGGPQDGAARDDDSELGEVVDLQLAGLRQHPHLPGVQHGVGHLGVVKGGDEVGVAVLGEEEHREALQGAESKAQQALEVEKPAAAEQTVADILIKPVVGGSLWTEHHGRQGLVGVLHHLALPVPGGVHQHHRGLVPVRPHLLHLDVRRGLEKGGDGEDPLHLLLLAQQQDVLQRGDLLLEGDGLVHVVGVADDDEGRGLLELLLEPLCVGETVGGQDGSSQVPDCQTEEPVLHVVAGPQTDHGALPDPQLGQTAAQSPGVPQASPEGLTAARGLVLQPATLRADGRQAVEDQPGERLLDQLRLSLPGRELAVAGGGDQALTQQLSS